MPLPCMEKTIITKFVNKREFEGSIQEQVYAFFNLIIHVEGYLIRYPHGTVIHHSVDI